MKEGSNPITWQRRPNELSEISGVWKVGDGSRVTIADDKVPAGTGTAGARSEGGVTKRKERSVSAVSSTNPRRPLHKGESYGQAPIFVARYADV